MLPSAQPIEYPHAYPIELPDSPTVYCDFQMGGDVREYDLAGGAVLTCHNGTAQVASPMGLGRRFDGVDDDIRSDRQIIPSASAFSIEVLVRADGQGGSNLGRLLGMSNGNAPHIALSSNVLIWLDTQAVNLTPVWTYPLWRHIVICRDIAGNVSSYANGVLVAAPSATANTDCALMTVIGSNAANTLTWNGMFRLMAVYPRILSQNDVTNRYQSVAWIVGLPV
jgi:Concanavalin A-like lectin/glucanases superfamily